MNKYPDFTNYGYQIIKELGRNLQGGRITYLASSLTSNQKVMIKEFRFALVDESWSAFKAYQREISVLKQLKHSHIPCYLDSFETEYGFGLVTEYISAPSLAERHIFTPLEVKQIAISVLEVLKYLQNFQPPIIHRDIKPENILVDENLQVYLVDFGLAKLRSGELALSSIAAGTPGFMPPEEMFNRPLSSASDLYSLGATLICLLTGTRSVEVDKLLDEDYRFKFKDLVPNLDLDWRFEKWLTKMVEPHPKRRYENAVLAWQELREIPVVGGEKIFAFQKDEVEVERKFVDREIPVGGGRERFAFPEDEVEVNQKFIGVIDRGEIVATDRGKIQENDKVFGVVDNGKIFAIGKGILQDKKKFVGVLGIAAIVSIFGSGSVIGLRNKVLVNRIPVISNLVDEVSIKNTLTGEIHTYRPPEYVVNKNEYTNLMSQFFTRKTLNPKIPTSLVCSDNSDCSNSNITKLKTTGECIKCYFKGVNLESTNLENANLQGADLEGANLQNTNLRNAKLKQTNLINTSINDQTILSDKWLTVWQIVNNKYQGINLKGIDLSGGFLIETNLENFDLESANLKDSNLRASKLLGANLQNANLQGSQLGGANLKNANLKNAKLEQANLRGALINDQTILSDKWRLVWQIVNNKYQGNNLKGVDLSEAYLLGINLRNFDLEGVNLKDAHLESAGLESANLKNANLENGMFINGRLDKANLQEANLKKAELSLASLKYMNLENANLKNADLRFANLTGANIQGADFTGANLEGATMPDGSIYNGKIDNYPVLPKP